MISRVTKKKLRREVKRVRKGAKARDEMVKHRMSMVKYCGLVLR